MISSPQKNPNDVIYFILNLNLNLKKLNKLLKKIK